MPVHPTGFFIVVDGVDATGKSTLVQHLAIALREIGNKTIVTREPGGTTLGEGIRALFLDPRQEVVGKAELMLLLAARAQHVNEVILPALQTNAIVITDRFTPSSLAYQGVARGLNVDTVKKLDSWATNNLTPDLTIILDAPIRITSTRMQKRSDGRTPTDRMEQDGRPLQVEVRQAFKQLAKREGWRVLDANQEPHAVLEQAYALTAGLLKSKAVRAETPQAALPQVT